MNFNMFPNMQKNHGHTYSLQLEQPMMIDLLEIHAHDLAELGFESRPLFLGNEKQWFSPCPFLSSLNFIC